VAAAILAYLAFAAAFVWQIRAAWQ
jgi:hypothetical protein